MRSDFLRLILSGLVCLFLGTQVSVHDRFAAEGLSDSESLDGLADVPEWLMVQVGDALPSDGLNIWVPTGAFETSSLIRVPRFPSSSDAIELIRPGQVLDADAVRNEQVSAQLAMAAPDPVTNLRVVVRALRAPDGSAIDQGNVRVRFVKYVPVHGTLTGFDYEEVNSEGVSGFRGPDVVGDPLLESETVDVPGLRAQPIWLTFQVPETAAPGVYEGGIDISSDQYETVRLPIALTVHDRAIPAPQTYSFHMDAFMNPSSIADYYNVTPWSEAHWKLLRAYFRNLALWGQKKITTTIVEEPWRKPWLHGELRPQTGTGWEGMVKWRLRANGEWTFDFSIFDRYVRTGLESGVGPYISAYSMLVFRGAQRITYFDERHEKVVVERVDVDSERFNEVWSVFLAKFSRHLKERGWLDQTYLGFDERPPELMKRVLTIIRQAAPTLEDRIYISGSPNVDKYATDLKIEYSFFPEGRRADASTLEVIKRRVAEGRPVRFYLTCCGDPHPNTYTYSPAVEARMLAWISLKYGLDGYSHWAYTSWPEKDVFTFPVFNYTQGDEYYVYPGRLGPMSSIRWELIKEGVEDFELVRVLKESGEIENARLDEAIRLATRNANGQAKDVHDVSKAREMLLQAGGKKEGRKEGTKGQRDKGG